METSIYYQQLNSSDQKVYMEKFSCIPIDPYLVQWNECSTDLTYFPDIQFPEIVLYLVYTKSMYTSEEMHAYKSLDSYKFAACGWVRDICVKNFGEFCLVLGKVLHSERLNEKPLLPWIIAEKSGKIKTAHCTCKAGLGGVCSHVAAVMFSIDKQMRNFEEVTRTGRKAYWMKPSSKPSQPKRVAEIDFIPLKKIFLDDCEVMRQKKTRDVIPPMTLEERQQFLQKLKGSSHTSVSHLITSPFAEEVKSYYDSKKKLYIMTHFKEEYIGKSLKELRTIAQSTAINITGEDMKKISSETKQQSKTKSWFLYRQGRITASLFKRCCKTNIEKPSLSLIKSICYSDTYKVKSKAVIYGCKHENQAARNFSDEMTKTHQNFRFERVGLIINPKYPYFGASPDGFTKCDCCGVSIVEIKCPYCARHSSVDDQMSKKSFYLEASRGSIVLKQTHAYYYQVQMQLALTKQLRCYFVVWSPTSLVYTTVLPDVEFWERESKKAKAFFYDVIMPEVLGKYYTSKEGKHQFEVEETLETEEIFWDPQLNWEVLVPQEESDYEEVTEQSELVSNVEEIICEAAMEVVSEVEVISEKTTGETVLENIMNTEEDVEKSLPGPSNMSCSESVYCYCKKKDDGQTPMIACDSYSCQIEWFHLKCVGLQSVPENLWYCPDCEENY